MKTSDESHTLRWSLRLQIISSSLSRTNLPPVIVPLVKLELPALGLSGQPQDLEVGTEESHVVETGYTPYARIEQLSGMCDDLR